MNRSRRTLLLAILMSAIGAPLPAQTSTAELVEVSAAQLPPTTMRPEGAVALAIAPTKWKHAVTDHFVIHYRRVTEAQKVVREIEFTLAWVEKELGADPKQDNRRSNVYVFEDEAEWKQFLATVQAPPWMASFAIGDELFLNVRNARAGGRFDSRPLAHETVHAVVARVYPNTRWPLWLNEGFAEYAAGASIADRKNQSTQRHQERLNFATLQPEEMFRLTAYPLDEAAVTALYQTAEQFVRFLKDDLSPDRFNDFLAAITAGEDPKEAIPRIYAGDVKSWDDVMKRYRRFSK